MNTWNKLKRYWVLPCLLGVTVLLSACRGDNGAAAAENQVETGRSQDETEQSQDETGRSQDETGRSQDETEQSQVSTEKSQASAEQSQDETVQSQVGAEKSQGSTEKNQAKKEQGQTDSAIPGVYAVPDGWTESKELSTKKKIFYVQKGHEKDKQPDNIAVSVGKNRYSIDQQTEFREAIVRQLMAQIKGSGSTLSGDGTYTEQGYPLYIFQINDPDSVTVQYYIVDDYRFCLIHLTNFTGSEEADQAVQTMADSFVWN